MIKLFKERKLVCNGTTFYPYKEVLIFDIETKKIKINGPISAANSELVIWGAYSYKSGKISFGKNSNIQKLIDDHKVIVGHNIKDFDIPVLEKLGCNFEYKVLVDLLEILRKPPSKGEKEAFKKKGKKPRSGKGRANIIGEARLIGMNDNRFPDFKLSTIAKHGHKLFGDHPTFSQFFGEYKDEDFNYDMLQNVDTEEKWRIVKDYLKKDIIVTKNIFEFLEHYFESMAHYLNEKDIENLTYMRAPTGSYTYKVICKELGLEEEYGEASGTFLGAFVFLPTQEKYGPEHGDGYCCDFNSQHPSHIRMMNLSTPVHLCKHKVDGKCPTAHSGDGKIFKLLGTYCACEQGKIEKLLTKFYLQRLVYKANKDPREYTIKIIINSIYGVLSSGIFKNTYHDTTGPDTTRMSAQSTKFMADWMVSNGYILTYGDTDSIYIMDPFNDKKRMKRYLKEGIDQIKATLPFADEHYDMGIDAEFSHIFFFEDETADKNYKKKNYIYILKPNRDGKIKVKLNGLPILKSNAPKLAKNIYINYLEKQIIDKLDIKFDKDYLKQLVHFEVSKDISILATKIKVQPANTYATESQLQAQASLHYLDGKGGFLTLIKHTREGLGIGKGKHYCTLDEAQRLSARELDMETVWKTLGPFIKTSKQLKLFDYQ